MAIDGFARYAIYWAPDPGAFADWAAAWLGWDPVGAVEVAHPELAELAVADLTATPRKYGFHGTVKPPFRLAHGMDADTLDRAVWELCDSLAPVVLPGLELHRIGGFVALTPEGDAAELASLAAKVVAGLDRFRLPPDEAEIARRRPDRLSPRQREHLAQWGYPYVMDEFQFHLTLSGDLEDAEAEALVSALHPAVTPLLPRPFVIDSLCLFGEGEDKRFRLLERYKLSG